MPEPIPRPAPEVDERLLRVGNPWCPQLGCVPDTHAAAEAPPAAVARRQPSKNLTLLVLALTGLMLILDLTITNVALPTIQRALRMTPQDLQWVVNAYALTGGGFMLLGGRLADRLGRRRVFLTGLATFTVASLLGGLAQSGLWLIAARGLQGLGAALAGPAALSLVTTTFAEGPERNRALGVQSAVTASGGAIGMVLGGLLTQYMSWRWVMFVNVPVGALVLAVTPRLVPIGSRAPATRTDIGGALTVTAGLVALVYATAQVPEHGWTAPRILLYLVVATLLFGVFLLIEARHPAPLVPLGIFRRRTLASADTVALLVGAGLTAAPIFFLNLYLQQILGFSVIAAGLASLPLGLAVITTSQVASRLVGAFGPRRLLVGGLVLSAIGLALLGRIEVGGSYLADVLGPILLHGLGLGLIFVPLMVSATAGVAPADQGLASGLLQTAQQLGVALGLALLTTIASGTTRNLLGQATAPDPGSLQEALTGGYGTALRGSALLAVAAVAFTLLLLRPGPAAPRLARAANNPDVG
jgi:EmrB/QacA subfamily drug resistance transporter